VRVGVDAGQFIIKRLVHKNFPNHESHESHE
jgi:hypothetical protein